jgi:hypothetical protein
MRCRVYTDMTDYRRAAAPVRARTIWNSGGSFPSGQAAQPLTARPGSVFGAATFRHISEARRVRAHAARGLPDFCPEALRVSSPASSTLQNWTSRVGFQQSYSS